MLHKNEETPPPEIREKKCWMTPVINIWNTGNLENLLGKGADGGTKTYVL